MSGAAASLLEDGIAGVAAPRGDPGSVQAHLDALTKPPGSLGRLESLALQVGVVLGDPPPPLDRAAVLIFAADHGATARGVSAYPAEVTAQMCANFADGGAAINVLTRACGAEVRVVDVGVAADLAGLDGIEHRKVRAGTENLSERPAMTADEVLEALAVGWWCWVAAAVATALCGWRFRARAGGVTGDFLGAAEQVNEIVILLAVLAAGVAGPFGGGGFLGAVP